MYILKTQNSHIKIGCLLLGFNIMLFMECIKQPAEVIKGEIVIAIGTAVKEEIWFIDKQSFEMYSKDIKGIVREPYPFKLTYSKVTFAIDTVFKGIETGIIEVFFHLPYPIEIEMGLQYIFKAKRGDFILIDKEKCLYPDSFYIIREGYHRRVSYLKGFKFEYSDIYDSIQKLP